MKRTAELQSLCMLLVGFIIFSGSSVAEGQNVNDDGILTFDDLPEGDPYNIATGVIYTGGFTLRTTWNIIDGFLKMISPAGPPYSVVTEAFAGNLDFQSALPQIQGNLVGFIVLFVLGMVFLLIFCLFLLIFCCCRLCGNCGGKMVQKNSSKFELKRYVFTGLLLLMLFFLVFAAVTALAVSGYTSSQVSSLPDTITNNIDDMLTYVNNTLEEIDFLILEQLSWTIDQVSDDLDGIDELVGVPVREALRPTVGAAIDAVYPLSAYISNTLSAMEDVNTTQSELETIYSNLASELSDIFNDLNVQCGSCGCCGGFDYSGLTMNMDPRDIDITLVHGTFPQAAVDVSISELQNVEDQDLTSAADLGSANFENIPTTLANTTSEVVSDLITTLEGLEGTIYSTINASTSQLSSLNTAATDLKGTLDPILDQAVDIDGYRNLAMSLVFGFMLVLVFLFVIGVVIAVIGHCLKKKPPASRSGIESCGGCVIMIAAVISAILVPPFLLISSFTFLIGGPVDRLVCDNLISLELFTETIDMPDTIVPGYFLGETIFQDSSINLTITGMLNACENNSGIYTAFKLDNLLNITQFTNIDGFVGDVDSQFGNITGDFSGVNILTGETRNILIDFRDGSADEISWDIFLNELDKKVTNDVNDGNDLSVLAADMRTAAGSITPASDATAIESLANELDSIQANYVDPFISTKNTLKSQVYILTNYTSNIDSIVNTTINAADTAQAYLDNRAVSLVQSNIIGYQDRVMGYPYQFATYIEDQIRNEVGKCLPVYNLYSSSVNTLCIGFVQAFNGFWYCLGLCCITMVFTFAFGVKSAKYYRKMKKDIGFEDQNYGYPLTENKVAPEQHP